MNGIYFYILVAMCDSRDVTCFVRVAAATMGLVSSSCWEEEHVSEEEEEDVVSFSWDTNLIRRR